MPCISHARELDSCSVGTGSARLQFRMLTIFTVIRALCLRHQIQLLFPKPTGFILLSYLSLWSRSKTRKKRNNLLKGCKAMCALPSRYYHYNCVVWLWWRSERFDLGYMDACEVLDCLWHRGWLWAGHAASPLPPAPPLPPGRSHRTLLIEAFLLLTGLF